MYKMSSYWVWVSVLVLLVVLDLRGLLVGGSLDLPLPSKRKPTSSVPGEQEIQHNYMHMKNWLIQSHIDCHEQPTMLMLILVS